MVITMMYIGSFYYLGLDGIQMYTPVWNWKDQSVHLATVFGNTVFVFIYHHSIPGIMYPVRPQKDVGKMFLIANIVGTCALFAEGMLAFIAFSGITTPCGKAAGETFPCAVQPLYNENF